MAQEVPEFRERSMGKYDCPDGVAMLLQDHLEMEAYYQQFGGSFVWFFDGIAGDGVEPLTNFRDRIQRGINKIRETFGQNPVVLFAHAGSIKMIRMIYENPAKEMPTYLSSYVPQNGEIHNTSESTHE